MITKDLINNILIKCLTHARMKEKLSSLSYDEKLNLLQENKLTRLELEDYKELNRVYQIERRKLERKYDKELKTIKHLAKKFGLDLTEQINKELNPKYDELFNELEDKYYNQQIFQYERGIFENYEVSKGDKPIPSFNWDDYTHDRNGIESYNVNNESGFVDMWDVKLHASRDSIGDYENSMINIQSDNVKYTPKELKWLRQYFTDDRLSSFLTYTINGREPKQFTDVKHIFYNDYEDDYVEYSLTDEWKTDYRNIKYHLDNAINKSEGLTKPTILYHSGRVDKSLLPGDKGVWKGYKSMSFQEQVMDKHRRLNDDYWNIIALTPTGTKGICANDERFRGFSFVDEHEYLMGRDTGYTVVSMDYDTHTQIVIVDG